MSLIETGCMLSVGDGLLATTSTVGTVNVNCTSSRTFATSLARTSKAVDTLSTNPALTAPSVYRPGGTSGKTTCPAPSLSVVASTVPGLLTQLHLSAGQLHGAFERGHGRHDTAVGGRLLLALIVERRVMRPRA